MIHSECTAGHLRLTAINSTQSHYYLLSISQEQTHTWCWNFYPGHSRKHIAVDPGSHPSTHPMAVSPPHAHHPAALSPPPSRHWSRCPRCRWSLSHAACKRWTGSSCGMEKWGQGVKSPCTIISCFLMSLDLYRWGACPLAKKAIGMASLTSVTSEVTMKWCCLHLHCHWHPLRLIEQGGIVLN